MTIIIRTTTVQSVQNSKFTNDNLVVYAGVKVSISTTGFSIQGKYFRLENIEGIDELIPLVPVRKIFNQATDAQVTSTWDGMTFTASDFAGKFREMILKVLIDTVVNDGAFGLTTGDWEEYII